MAKQGKCDFCMKRFTWIKDKKIELCRCPRCGSRLFQTTHKIWYPLIKIEEPVYKHRISKLDREIDRELERLTGRIVE